jgi:hypothetical protein
MAERPTRVRELILSDYRAFSGLRGDGPLKRRMLALPRMLLNPSLHAVVLVRLANGSPRWLHWFWRNVLMWKHSMELVYRSSIGPGLVLPHPIGIVIGRDVRIGRDARIMHNVVIGPNFLDDRMPVIGDAVELCRCVRRLRRPGRPRRQCAESQAASCARDARETRSWHRRPVRLSTRRPEPRLCPPGW